MISHDHKTGDGRQISKNGTVEIRDGQIIITDPEGSGKEATITPNKGIKMFVDGVEATGSTPVFENSKIKTEIENNEPERKFSINVEEDGLSASVTVEYKDGMKYVLKDRFSSNSLVLDAAAGGRIECPRYTMEEAMAMLKEKEIVYGIIEDNLADAIAGGNGLPVVAAKGLEPVNGTDDRIDLKFDDHKKFVEINDRIDFYSIGKVVSVEPNTLIAEKVPGDEGKPGMDVWGKEIQQSKGKRIMLKAGKGTSLSDDGMKAYSTILGRPDVKDDMVSVHEVYEVAADVDVSTGNIEFMGDVVIKGSISEGMKVRAGNSVILFGSVIGGEITAGSDVTVYKNIISSRVKAGCNDILKYKIIENLDAISKTLNGIFSSVVYLKESGKVPKIYKDGQIIKLLIDTKFNKLNSEVTELRNMLADNKEYLDIGALRLGARLVKYFMGNGSLLIEDYTSLKTYIEEIDNHISILKSELRQPSTISAYYVQNSTLTTSGDIKITGKGCYTSELSCRGGVTIDKIGSVTRGGSISAEGEVKVHELGSSGGAPTMISTGKDAVIYCEIAHVNCGIKVGDMSSKLDSSVKKLKACLYKGELMIEKSKM